MQTPERVGQSLIVLDQPSEAVGPAKRAFDHPVPGQKHKAAFGFFELDSMQFYAFLSRFLPYKKF